MRIRRARPNELLRCSAVMNSRAFDSLVRLRVLVDVRLVTRSDLFSGLPLPRDLIAEYEQPASATLARRGWSLRRSLDTVIEVSHAFVVPAVLQVEGGSFGERVRRGLSGWLRSRRSSVGCSARLMSCVSSCTGSRRRIGGRSPRGSVSPTATATMTTSMTMTMTTSRVGGRAGSGGVGGGVGVVGGGGGGWPVRCASSDR